MWPTPAVSLHTATFVGPRARARATLRGDASHEIRLPFERRRHLSWPPSQEDSRPRPFSGPRRIVRAMVRPPCFMRAPLRVQKERGTQRARSRPDRTESEAKGISTPTSGVTTEEASQDATAETVARAHQEPQRSPEITRCLWEPPKRSRGRCVGGRRPTEVEIGTPQRCSVPEPPPKWVSRARAGEQRSPEVQSSPTLRAHRSETAKVPRCTKDLPLHRSEGAESHTSKRSSDPATSTEADLS